MSEPPVNDVAEKVAGNLDKDTLVDALSKMDVEALFRQILEYIRELRVPELPHPEEILDLVTSMHLITGVIVCGLGFTFLAFGLKKYKAFMMLNGAFLGAFLGGVLCAWLNIPDYTIYGMILLGIVLGAICWPLAKGLIALVGGGVGAFIGHVLFGILFEANPEDMQYEWVGVLAGALVMAVLFLFLFRMAIVLLTTAQGAAMMVTGGLRLISESEGGYAPIEAKLIETPGLIYIVLSGFAIVGLAIQFAFLMSDYQSRKAARQGSKDGD